MCSRIITNGFARAAACFAKSESFLERSRCAAKSTPMHQLGKALFRGALLRFVSPSHYRISLV